MSDPGDSDHSENIFGTTNVPVKCSEYETEFGRKYIHRYRPNRDARKRSLYNCVLKTAQDKRLIVAAATNNTDLLERLLKQGANPNTCDSMKRSPLHISACGGYVDIIKCLVRYGANPNIRDIMDNTPLHLAACTSNVPVVIALLDAGTDVSSLNTNGMNPLQLAQSKLRLIQNLPSAAETEKLKNEIQQIGEMMHKFLRTDISEMDALNERLKNMSTREEVDNEVQSLLDNLKSLSLCTK